MAGVQPSDAEVRAAVLRYGLRLQRSRRQGGITPVGSGPPLAEPPPSWGLEPTARDQAAIDAGNA